MATCREICTSALRKIGVDGTETSRAPVAFNAEVAMGVLKGWYESAIANGMFGRLTDVVIRDDYTASEWERVTNIGDAEVVVTLPDTIDERGPERVPRDLAPIVVIYPDNDPFNYVYDGARGAWVALHALTLDDNAPFSQRGHNGLACVLAVAITEDLGGEVGPVTVDGARRFIGGLMSKSGSERQSVGAEYF